MLLVSALTWRVYFALVPSMKQLRTLRMCSSTDRQLLVLAGVLLSMVRVGLWRLPFRSILQLVRRTAKLRLPSALLARTTDEQMVWAVRATSRYVPDATCLTQALVTQILFALRGRESQLRIGVAKDSQGRLEAHAWVECEGRVLIGSLPNLTRFVQLPSLEQARP